MRSTTRDSSFRILGLWCEPVVRSTRVTVRTSSRAWAEGATTRETRRLSFSQSGERGGL